MTKSKKKPKDLQLRQIRHKQVLGGLASAALLACIVSRCSSQNPDEPIDVLFYENTAQCETDIKDQQAEYLALKKIYDQNPQEEEKPTYPRMVVADCAPQMLAAQQEYEKTAPVYTTEADCQAEGVKCETTPSGTETAGYRPVYGGTYIDHYSTNYIDFNYGGQQHRIFESGSVYRSSTFGKLVTPYGREISSTTTGRVTVPMHTTFSAPSRPAGTSGKGTIKGRSSQGFGSSFKGTGSGGK
jgi:uncharacterized protein YgiB involved in biofilm formation